MLEFSISDGENFEFPPKLFGGKIEILSSSESLGVLRHIIGRKNSSERWDREVWEFAGFENQVRECFTTTANSILKPRTLMILKTKHSALCVTKSYLTTILEFVFYAGSSLV